MAPNTHQTPDLHDAVKQLTAVAYDHVETTPLLVLDYIDELNAALDVADGDDRS